MALETITGSADAESLVRMPWGRREQDGSRRQPVYLVVVELDDVGRQWQLREQRVIRGSVALSDEPISPPMQTTPSTPSRLSGTPSVAGRHNLRSAPASTSQSPNRSAGSTSDGCSTNSRVVTLTRLAGSLNRHSEPESQSAVARPSPFGAESRRRPKAIAAASCIGRKPIRG
jgi:hypothetical protein